MTPIKTIVDDHDLLIRIDSKLNMLVKSSEIQETEIDELKMWKNRMAGGLSIVLGITSYSFLM